MAGVLQAAAGVLHGGGGAVVEAFARLINLILVFGEMFFIEGYV